MDKRKPVICVFCGSSFGTNPRHAAEAGKLGRMIAERGFNLVYGGGGLGLMGTVAGAARAGGSAVKGIIPEFLRRIEQPPEWEKELEVTADLQLRKTRMLEESDAFIVLPGGAGTMDEFFEVVTSVQLQVFDKPILVVNTDDYFAPLQTLMEHMVREGFAKPAMLTYYRFVETPEAAMDAVAEALSAPAGE
jgi:uncharacterized protein (TIGR00730 family)